MRDARSVWIRALEAAEHFVNGNDEGWQAQALTAGGVHEQLSTTLRYAKKRGNNVRGTDIDLRREGGREDARMIRRMLGNCVESSGVERRDAATDTRAAVRWAVLCRSALMQHAIALEAILCVEVADKARKSRVWK